jgi:hypothetical protein
MFDLMVGYSMPETMGLKLSAAYHMDSGDDNAGDDKTETYQPLYYDSHKYAGLMDILGWGNLTYWNINASVMPAARPRSWSRSLRLHEVKRERCDQSDFTTRRNNSYCSQRTKLISVWNSTSTLLKSTLAASKSMLTLARSCQVLHSKMRRQRSRRLSCKLA